MARAPRFIAQIRGGANPGAFSTPGGADVGAALSRTGGGLLDLGFDQMTRQAIQEAQIEGRAAGEAAGSEGVEPQQAPATLAGQAYNQSAQRAFIQRQTRKETIENIRATSNFQLSAQQEMERMMAEGDITSPTAAEEYTSYLENTQNELLSDSNLSEFGKLQLQQKLEVYRMQFASQFGSSVSQEEQKMINESATGAIREVTANVARNPDDLVSHFQDIDARIDQLAPAMTPDQELQYRDVGRREATKTAVTSMLSNGDVRGARRLIEETPGLIETMDPNEQRLILGGIANAEKAQQATGNSVAMKLAEIEQVLGRPLTESEKLTKLGLSKGGQSLADKVAEVESVVGRLSPQQKAQLAGLDKAALTDPGKWVQDRQMMVEQYGADSEQVKAFDDASNVTENADLSDIAGARKEFTALSKDFVKIRDAYSKIEVAKNAETPAGDLSLIYNYMKLLDPGSTVMQGEQADASNAGGVDSKIRNLYNSVVKGHRLDKTQRSDFLGRAVDIAGVQMRSQIRLENEYSRIAKAARLPANQVVVDFVGDEMRDGFTLDEQQPQGEPPVDGGGEDSPDGDESKKESKPTRRIRLDMNGQPIGGMGGGG